MFINKEKQQAFWQSYTKEKISDDDIIEINKNLYDFAKVLVEISKIEKTRKAKEDDN